jgi:hypothetical protein
MKLFELYIIYISYKKLNKKDFLSIRINNSKNIKD